MNADECTVLQQALHNVAKMGNAIFELREGKIWASVCRKSPRSLDRKTSSRRGPTDSRYSKGPGLPRRRFKDKHKRTVIYSNGHVANRIGLVFADQSFARSRWTGSATVLAPFHPRAEKPTLVEQRPSTIHCFALLLPNCMLVSTAHCFGLTNESSCAGQLFRETPSPSKPQVVSEIGMSPPRPVRDSRLSGPSLLGASHQRRQSTHHLLRRYSTWSY